jgi:hypothetical protein
MDGDQRMKQNERSMSRYWDLLRGLRHPRLVSTWLYGRVKTICCTTRCSARSYASPPLSPKHWAELDLHRSWDNLMDGDQRMKQMVVWPGQNHLLHDQVLCERHFQTETLTFHSASYVYTGSSFHGGSLQSNELQNYQPQDYARAQRPQQVRLVSTWLYGRVKTICCTTRCSASGISRPRH